MKIPRSSLVPSGRLRAGVFLCTAAFWLCACQISVKPREPDTHGDLAKEDIAASGEQIRLRMRALVDPMCGEVESAADRILAGTDDPAVRRAALDWKAQAVPALRESLFQPDPGTALFDTWVLTNQMTIYFSQGEGGRRLGKARQIAVATCLSMERRMNTVAASLTRSGDVTGVRALAREWAAAHPIDRSIAHRESTLSRAARFDLGPELTATEAIGDITTTVDDLSRRLEIYSDQLLRQARWEAELTADDLTRDLKLDQAMPLAGEAVASVGVLADSVESISGSIDKGVGSVEELMPVIERLTKLAEALPEVVATERAAALRSVTGELDRTLESVRGERVAVLQHITAERLAAMQSLHEVVATEREILTADVREFSIKAIDHAFLRAAQLGAALVAVLAILGLAALLLVRSWIPMLLRELAASRA